MRVLIKHSRRADQFSAERKQLLDELAKSGLISLFYLARVLPPPLLRRAIRLVRAAKNYPKRDQLLEVLGSYLARRSKYPATLDRDIRSSRSRLRGPERTLPQMLVPLSADERFDILRRTITRLETQQVQRRRAASTPIGPGSGGPPQSPGRSSGKTATRGSVTKVDERTVLRRKATGRSGGSTRGGPTADARAAILFRAKLRTKSPRPGPEKASARKRKPAKRVVSTGFALPAHPAKPIKSNMPLTAGEQYFFWLEVGARVSGSIEVKEEALPTETLPEEAMLDVVLFEVKDGLKLVSGQDTGRLKLEIGGTVSVENQPTTLPPPSLSSNSRILKRRLFFPVIATEDTGTFRLRCNIYYGTVLVQSRIVSARVMRRPRATDKALQAKVDYTLSQTLGVSHVSGIRPHLLSIMLNSSGKGTHDFFFFGAQNFEKENISFDGEQLQKLIEQARNAYALAAWGSNNPWQNQPYLYADARAKNLAQLKSDLTRFAIRGYNIYDAIANRLAGGAENATALAKLMGKPGRIQIALKESPRFVLPAAIIYDYPIDVDGRKFDLCPAFLSALETDSFLEESVCFKGECATKDDDTVVCPSGFWGYRHELGIPLSVGNGPDAPTTIEWKDKPILTVAVSTDPVFVLREQHLQRIKALRSGGLEWNYGATRDDVIRELKATKPQLVYFYCHGGVSETRPYLQVGTPDPTGNLSPSFLRAKKIRWDLRRPLVFINGCHTTALEPEQAIEFISPFIENANAAGVIGTEITIFEPLATVFAEECLRRFLNGAAIGEAIRGARLKLLKSANPLGLVYIPYAIADLHLVEQKNGM